MRTGVVVFAVTSLSLFATCKISNASKTEEKVIQKEESIKNVLDPLEKKKPGLSVKEVDKVDTAKKRAQLLNPKHPDNNKKAPVSFKVEFNTSKGKFVVEAHREWAPLGVDRFYNLVNNGYFEQVSFFRVVAGFMAQFGVSSDKEVNAVWSIAKIKDDPTNKSNTRGMLTFAMAGKDTRTTQFFINFGDNSRLDKWGAGFPPIAKVVSGMEVVDKIYNGYGDMPSQGGRGPDPSRIAAEGIDYLKKNFPKVDYILSTKLLLE